MAIYVQVGPFAMDESFIYTFFPLLAAVLLLIYIKSKETNEAAKVQEAPSTYILWDPDRKTTQATTPSFLQEPITPLDVDILSTPPHPFRPYKPIYHMTMGLEKCVPNDLFLIDSSYPSRIALRKQIVNAFPHTSLGASERCGPAIKELYSYILPQHLPSRFPGLFATSTFNGEFKNYVSGDSYPLLPPQNSIEALKILATTVEEDILILQKESGKETYSLQGFIACFPNGFDSSKKMGMELREIHEPWTISTHEKLFLPTGNHHYEGEDLPEELESVDLEKTYLRVERQVLLRLPVSRDIVFFVRTYMTPLARIKAEGQGEALATAIDGFPERLGVYKRRIVWGRAVQEALRA
ncbi:hypothetical protein TWF173_010611 [Orbilia oligospora]|nr:hypothetical protein TWF173_010611 [Orbilia oligospora]